MNDDERTAGEGTLDQIQADLEGLSSLDAKYVLFNTYEGDPASTLHSEADWSLLSLLAEGVIDLNNHRYDKGF